MAADGLNAIICGTSPASLDSASLVSLNSANEAALANMRHPGADSAMQSPSLSNLSATGSTAVLSPGLSAVSSTPEDTGSLSLDKLSDDETEFQRWLKADRQQDPAPNPEAPCRQLDDGGYKSRGDAEREARRPKLSVATRDILLRDPDVHESTRHASRSISTRHIEGSAVSSPSISTSPGAGIFTPRSPLPTYATFGNEMAGRSHTVDTPWPPLPDGLPTTARLVGGEMTRREGQCHACATFREALFEALYLLHNLPNTTSSNTAKHGPLKDGISKRSYRLRKRQPVYKTACEDSDDNHVRSIDELSNAGDDGALFSEGQDKGFLDDEGKAKSLSCKRRRWSELEERRLRAWKMEGKSEPWIASKLNRTESAVKQQLRKMS